MAALDGYVFRREAEKLLFEDGYNPSEQDYIRFAVDSMRRSTYHGALTEHTIRDVEEVSYPLARYTAVIRMLFNRRTERFNSKDKIENLIRDIARTIDPRYDLPQLGELKADERQAVENFLSELFLRFNGKENYDPVETVALIEYRMRYASHIFSNRDRRIPEALSAFFLMRENMRLPDYRQIRALRNAGKKLPRLTKATLTELEKPIDELVREGAFQAWVAAFRLQFREALKQEPAKSTIQPDPWKIKDTRAMDHGSTAYKYAVRGTTDMDALRSATNSRPELLALYDPQRMALHEIIAAAVTQIQMTDPVEFLDTYIVGENGLYGEFVQPRISEKLDQHFREDIQIIEDYVDYTMDDQFHIVNPNMELREELAKARDLIIKNIQSGSYDPYMVESRAVLKHLVTDTLVRQRYLKQVCRIVDDVVERYLQKNPDSRLPLKRDSERISWVTVGGPASGKSTLEDLIGFEYWELYKRLNTLCQINSDHYKPFLLVKTEGNAEHGAQTFWESGMVRERAIQRLTKMVEKDHLAPDFWISTMTPVPERMRLVGTGGAKVNIYAVSCPVEGETGDVMRAYKRAQKQGTEDYLRFMSTEMILRNHKIASAEMPKALAMNRRDFRLINTADWEPVVSATMDSHKREMSIFDPRGFLEFVKKSLINEKATREEDVYAGITDKHIAMQLCRYPKSGITLSFRYGDFVKNTILDDIRQIPFSYDVERLSKEGEEESRKKQERTRKLSTKMQRETYLWISPATAVIHDFSTFVNVFGVSLAEVILLQLIKHCHVTISDYMGRQLLQTLKVKNNTISRRKLRFLPPRSTRFVVKLEKRHYNGTDVITQNDLREILDRVYRTTNRGRK